MRALPPVLLALVWLGCNASSAASPEEIYRAAQDRLVSEYDEFKVEEEASSPTLKEFWEAADGLLAARGPEGLVQSLTVESLPLRQGTMLVAVNWEQFGHLAVLENGKVVWSSSSDQSAPGCWRGVPGRPCATSGIGTRPPEIGLLPVEADGTARFFVLADYAQFAGGTRGHQLSLWRWKNGKAEAFFTTDFITGGDAPQGAVLKGDVLEVTGKSSWSNFSVCGSCDGRQQSRRLHLNATGVDDLGIVSLTPELDAVDRLLGRLATKLSTDDIAAPAAAAMLQKSWHDTIFLIDPPVTLDRAVCLAPEDLPPLTFRFAPDPPALRLIAVEPGRCR